MFKESEKKKKLGLSGLNTYCSTATYLHFDICFKHPYILPLNC